MKRFVDDILVGLFVFFVLLIVMMTGMEHYYSKVRNQAKPSPAIERPLRRIPPPAPPIPVKFARSTAPVVEFYL